MNRFRMVLAALVLAGAHHAVAQIPTSTHDRLTTPIDPRASEIARTDRVFRETVECTIGRQTSRSRNLLDTVPGTHSEGTILSSFQSRLDSCYNAYRNQGRSLGFYANLLRGTIAEHFYRVEVPNGLSAARDIAPELTAAWTRPRLVDGETTQTEMVHSMARCVTVRQPETVRAMLAAEPLSSGEREAIRALQPDLGACLDTGVSFEASRQAIRGLLAEAALHYALASRDGFTRAGETLAASD